MSKPTLVIMAAGIGSRYGGLKQLDAIGPNGEIIMDYSIYDAVKAGFGSVVFIINRNIEKPFKEYFGSRIQNVVETKYVYQSVSDVPPGFIVPEGRIKPWGTGHAVLSCRNAVSTPFAVINADDFYGASSFRKICEYLTNLNEKARRNEYCMVGFRLENTLTENGYVSRGICSVDSEGYLKEIQERTKIQKVGDAVKYTEDNVSWTEIPPESTVSMNMWGFTPSIFKELEERFPKFLEENKDRLEKAEFFIPSIVHDLIVSGKARVKVLSSEDKWYGVTYKEDKPKVMQAIQNMIKCGLYPSSLWG